MTRRITDGALSAEEFEALSPSQQVAALLDLIDAFIAGSSGRDMDAWHVTKIRHALANIGKGMVDAAAHDLARADQVPHGEPEDGARDVTVATLRDEALAARKKLRT